MADVGLSVLDQGRENLGLSSLSCKHCLSAARDKVTGADSAQMYRTQPSPYSCILESCLGTR